MHKLGQPLPNSPHAVSVSLPKWADVIGYEEGEPRVIEAMQLGYPRFVYHPYVAKLFKECAEKFADDDEFCQAYPSKQVAECCVKYCETGRIEEFSEDIFAVILPKGLEAKAKQFWQHAGFGVSSRFAQSRDSKFTTQDSKDKIKIKLSKLTGADNDDIYLFPSGMAAIFTAHKLTQSTINNQQSTIQLGFPYVDSLKIQQRFGDVEFVQFDDYKKLSSIKASAIFTEYPLNPMLELVDFEKVKQAVGETPIIIDDTLCAWQGFSTLDHADIAVTSLTKFFSGVGDVMAGSLILSKKSPHYQQFKTALDNIYEDLLYADDAEILAKNCQDFEERIKKIISNSKELVSFLKQTINNQQSTINHFNGMISIILETEAEAIKFYDNLNVSKGPSLGTEYTLACPYTLLAHYNELDWAKSLGIPAHLIRISVGCEDIDELKEVFTNAI